MGTTDATDWRAHVDKALSAAERSLGIAGSPQKASRRPHAGQLGRSDAYGPPASGGHSLVLPSAFRADGRHAPHGAMRHGSPSPPPEQATEPARRELSTLISSAQGTIAELRAESRAAASAAGEPRVSAEEVCRATERAELANQAVRRLEQQASSFERRVKSSARNVARSHTRREVGRHVEQAMDRMQRQLSPDAQDSKLEAVRQADTAREHDRRISDRQYAQLAAYACLAIASAESARRRVEQGMLDCSFTLREHSQKTNDPPHSISDAPDEMQSQGHSVRSAFDKHRASVHEELANVHSSLESTADEADSRVRERIERDLAPLRERMSQLERKINADAKRIDAVECKTQSTSSKAEGSMRDPGDTDSDMHKQLEDLKQRLRAQEFSNDELSSKVDILSAKMENNRTQLQQAVDQRNTSESEPQRLG